MKYALSLLAVLALTVAAVARAEVRPNNEVVAAYCGNPTRSHQVCISFTNDQTPVIELQTFPGGAQNVIFAPAEIVERNPAIGATTTIYRGSYVAIENNRPMLHTIALRTTQVIARTFVMKGVLTIDNELPQPSFEDFHMEPIGHTL